MADSTSRESGVNISVDESHVAPAPDRSHLASPEDGDLIVQGLTQDLEDGKPLKLRTSHNRKSLMFEDT